jgi:hypothetical protein
MDIASMYHYRLLLFFLYLDKARNPAGTMVVVETVAVVVVVDVGL